MCGFFSRNQISCSSLALIKNFISNGVCANGVNGKNASNIFFLRHTFAASDAASKVPDDLPPPAGGLGPL